MDIDNWNALDIAIKDAHRFSPETHGILTIKQFPLIYLNSEKVKWEFYSKKGGAGKIEFTSMGFSISNILSAAEILLKTICARVLPVSISLLSQAQITLHPFHICNSKYFLTKKIKLLMSSKSCRGRISLRRAFLVCADMSEFVFSNAVETRARKWSNNVGNVFDFRLARK